METHIAIPSGNRIHNFPHSTRLRLHLGGYSVVPSIILVIGVDRTVSCHRPEAERVDTSLNKTVFPGAKLESAPRLADSIDVKVVLGHDPGPQKPAEAQQAHGARP